MGDDHPYGQEHVDRHRATDGHEGCRWRWDPEILLLATPDRQLPVVLEHPA